MARCTRRILCVDFTNVYGVHIRIVYGQIYRWRQPYICHTYINHIFFLIVIDIRPFLLTTIYIYGPFTSFAFAKYVRCIWPYIHGM
jgi:hypothetical protein